MNGGLDHALDVMGRDAERAAQGWERLGRPDVGELIREALRALPGMPDDRDARQRFFIDGWTDAQAAAIEVLDARYPDDAVVEQAFLRTLRERPDDFASNQRRGRDDRAASRRSEVWP